MLHQELKTLNNSPSMIKDSSPGDNGNLLLDQEEKDKIISQNPNAAKFIKKHIGASESIKGVSRYCIHMTADTVKDVYKIKTPAERFEKAEIFRLNSKQLATKKKAETPHYFDEDKHQEGEFILVPQTGSERRNHIPIGYFDDSYVPSNATRVIYKVQPWLFGVISSKMHIVWVKALLRLREKVA